MDALAYNVSFSSKFVSKGLELSYGELSRRKFFCMCLDVFCLRGEGNDFRGLRDKIFVTLGQRLTYFSQLQKFDSLECLINIGYLFS